MPRTSSTDRTLVEKAVENVQKHPTLTVPEAMQLAGFPPEQVKCRSTQRIVIRALPGKKKGGDAAASSSSKCSNSIASVNITMGGSSDLSPLTDDSANATTTSSEQNNNSPLVERENALLHALNDLEYVVDMDVFPDAIEKYHMPPMQCVPYDAHSEYVMRNPHILPKDNWWNHLTVDYKHEGQVIPSTMLVLGNCFLDLHAHDKGKMAANYAKELVSVYIPFATYLEITKIALKESGFLSVAKGGEIVDEDRGYVSVLCQRVSKTEDLRVVMYKTTVADDEKEEPDGKEPGTDDEIEELALDLDEKTKLNDGSYLMEATRDELEMAQVYQAAQAFPGFRILQGIAFVRVGLSYSCDVGTHSQEEGPPLTVMPDLKFKLYSFHSLRHVGDVFDPIVRKYRTSYRLDK